MQGFRELAESICLIRLEPLSFSLPRRTDVGVGPLAKLQGRSVISRFPDSRVCFIIYVNWRCYKERVNTRNSMVILFLFGVIGLENPNKEKEDPPVCLGGRDAVGGRGQIRQLDPQADPCPSLESHRDCSGHARLRLLMVNKTAPFPSWQRGEGSPGGNANLFSVTSFPISLCWRLFLTSLLPSASPALAFP